jgi:hypothetical protein
VLQSTNARFGWAGSPRRSAEPGGEEVAEIIERVYGGDRPSVTAEERARCSTLSAVG